MRFLASRQLRPSFLVSEKSEPTFTMQARVLLIAFILLGPATVTSLGSTRPFNPLRGMVIHGRLGQRTLTSLHHPGMIPKARKIWGRSMQDGGMGLVQCGICGWGCKELNTPETSGKAGVPLCHVMPRAVALDSMRAANHSAVGAEEPCRGSCTPSASSHPGRRSWQIHRLRGALLRTVGRMDSIYGHLHCTYVLIFILTGCYRTTLSFSATADN